MKPLWDILVSRGFFVEGLGMSNTNSNDVNLHRKTWIALLSVLSNATLVVTKLIVGLLVASVSIMSEAIHSGVDMLASAIALFSVRTSSKPADDEHPFGHGKYENISGAAEAILIFLAAWWIVREAVHKLIFPQPLEMLGWGVLIMFVSTIVNMGVSRTLIKVGKETDSIALKADAWHHKTDVYTSAGVMTGLAIVWIGKMIFPKLNLSWVDPIIAIGVAILIVKAAWNLTVESVRDLLDVRIPKEDEKWIRDYVGQMTNVIRGFHGLRTRKAGSMRFIEFHLVFEVNMTVGEAHRISHHVGNAITQRFPGAVIINHIEPCDGSCKVSCVGGCMLTAEAREQKRESYRRTHGSLSP